MELRESQGYQTTKIHHIFISLDQHLQKVDLNSQSLPPTIIDGWIASLLEKLSVNTVNVYISTYIQFAKYLQSLGYDAFIPEHSRNICLHFLRHSFAVAAVRQLDSNGLDMYNDFITLP